MWWMYVADYVRIHWAPFSLPQHGATVMITTCEGADGNKHEDSAGNFNCFDKLPGPLNYSRDIVIIFFQGLLRCIESIESTDNDTCSIQRNFRLLDDYTRALGSILSVMRSLWESWREAGESFVILESLFRMFKSNIKSILRRRSQETCLSPVPLMAFRVAHNIISHQYEFTTV